MALKHQMCAYAAKSGLEEDEITWFSNSKRFSECCTVGLADVKLHGAQTGFLRCADGFPVWKGVKLQGTQTAYGTGRCYNKPCEQKPTPGL